MRERKKTERERRERKRKREREEKKESREKRETERERARAQESFVSLTLCLSHFLTLSLICATAVQPLCARTGVSTCPVMDIVSW